MIIKKTKIFSDLGFLSIAHLSSAFFAFLTNIILARIFTVNEYGSITFVITLYTILSLFISFGNDKFLMRVSAEKRGRSFSWIKKGLIINLILLLLVLGVLIVVLFNFKLEKTLLYLITWFIPLLIAQSFSYLSIAIYQVEQRYRMVALYRLFNHGSKFSVSLVILLINQSINLFVYLIAIFSVITLILYILPIFRLIRSRIQIFGKYEKVVTENVSLIEAFKYMYPYALSGMFYLAYNQSDLLMLGVLDSHFAVGIYNTAFLVLTMIYLIPSILYQSYLLPKIHNWYSSNSPLLSKVYIYGNKIMYNLAILITLLVIQFASLFILIFFGERYFEAIDVIKIMAIAIIFRFLSVSAGTFLVTGDNQIKKVKYQIPAVVTNVILNFILIPIYGVKGAAISTVVSEFIIMVMFFYGVRKYVFKEKSKQKLNYTDIKIIILFICFVFISYYENNVYANIILLIVIIVLSFFSTYKLYKQALRSK